jgi:hypothetical protein
MYNILQVQFAEDKLTKHRSEEILLPTGSLLDNLKKLEETQDIDVKSRKNNHIGVSIT